MGILPFTVLTCSSTFLPDTGELSACTEEKEERSRELTVLLVMNGSADPLRSHSSMISILINMCFITPLKHTNCKFTVSRKSAGSPAGLNLCKSAKWSTKGQYFLACIQHLATFNQGPFQQKQTCYAHIPVLTASRAENKCLTSLSLTHTQTHTKTQWPWEIEGPEDEDGRSALCVITPCVFMSCGLSHPVQWKTLHTLQPHRPIHVRTHSCVLSSAGYLRLKPEYGPASHNHLPALTHTQTRLSADAGSHMIFFKLPPDVWTICCWCLSSYVSTCF